MEKYIGVKLIEAEPMNLVDAEEYLHRKIKEGHEDGYLVRYPDGYESWSPKNVFEEAYRRLDNLTFGLAIEAMKKGFMVARKGWNGKGMFIYLVSSKLVKHEDFKAEAVKAIKLAYKGEGNVDNAPSDRIVNAHIDMKTADGHITVGWNPSQPGMMAEDWEIVE